MTKDLSIKISIDNKTGELKVIQKEIDGLNNKVNSTSTSADKFAKRLTDMAHAAVGIYAINKAFEATENIIKSLIDTASEFERFDTILTTLEGSSKKAQKSMDWIVDFASTTPYQLNQVTDSFVKLKSYGIDPVDKTLRTLGDAASAMGKDLNQAVEAMADAVVGENERLKEFGIRAAQQGDKIAYSWTDASGKMKNIVVKNNSEVIKSTLNAIFNSKYAGAMEAQSKTYAGMLSNMSDNWTKFQMELMDDGAFVAVKALIKTMGDEFNRVYKNILENTGEFNNSFGSYIHDAIITIGKFANAFEGVALVTSTVFNSIKTVVSGIAAFILNRVNFIIDSVNKIPGVDIDNSLLKSLEDGYIENAKDGIESIKKSFEGLVDYEQLASNIAKEYTANIKELGNEAEKTAKKTKVVGASDGAFKGFNAGDAAEKQAKAAADVYDKYLSIVGTKEEQFTRSMSETMRALAESGTLTAEQLQEAFAVLNKDYEINLTINGLDDMQSKFDDMIDSQISLATGVNDWGTI